MTKRAIETSMMHYECLTCGVNATCVATLAAAEAWHDHMANHEDPRSYKLVTWVAVQLPLE